MQKEEVKVGDFWVYLPPDLSEWVAIWRIDAVTGSKVMATPVFSRSNFINGAGPIHLSDPKKTRWKKIDMCNTLLGKEILCLNH